MSNIKQKDTWPSYAFRLVVSSASHPFEYAKILIQVRDTFFPKELSYIYSSACLTDWPRTDSPATVYYTFW